MKKILIFLIGLMIISCSPGKKRSEMPGAKINLSIFPIKTTNNEPAVENATLQVAIVKDDPLVGVFNEILYQDGYDGDILSMFLSSSLFDVNENFEIIDTGVATLNVDAKNKKATIKIKDGIKWSDGVPLTADDIVYAYEVLGNKDYTGIRYTEEFQKVIGMNDYHNGKAKTISGVKKIDDKTVEISFSEMGQSIFSGGNGLMANALPKHYLKDVPIKNLVSSDKIRTKPVTLGPYNLVKISRGESMEFVANPYYYKGKPKIKKAILQVVNPQSIVAALKAGKYDYVMEMPDNLYNNYKDFNNLEVLGQQDLYYSYVGFKLGHFDKAKGENVSDPNAKMADLNLRQAMIYAIDVDQITQAFYFGLRQRATSTVPPVFKKYFPKDLTGFPYNLAKAKQLLDESGYKDVNNDGFREDKNGKPLQIKMAFMAGGDVAEPLAQFYLQSWKKIGLNVSLTSGRLLAFQNFYEKVQGDTKDIDVFFGAWGVGTDVNPTSSAGRSSQLNYTRFTSPENDKFIDEILGEKSLTIPNYKAQMYKEWQKYYINQASEVPLMYKYKLTPVNKRLKNVYIGYDSALKDEGIHKWELTAVNPMR
ncbi:oligopeptide ABC transporter substrate-binding protein [Leptotrichia sp. oral taxon 218]|jgi:extracellular solute-binding protein family 5|uniref:oligopeptide ABC transporter substrate-binding protein n=1 Tax=Leptotrichia sp. oral taxon 218 TaxID=712361 RepID=UPI001B8CD60D|nr:oligopeptide ABC transporter substrate-binding protein [Leptotrichia sp. oral taxon 218]QUB95736.1 oligopeptide ABC transporter substrate-binding protein [Leptotrichia sp. oral taxon 218]